MKLLGFLENRVQKHKLLCYCLIHRNESYCQKLSLIPCPLKVETFWSYREKNGQNKIKITEAKWIVKYNTAVVALTSFGRLFLDKQWFCKGSADCLTDNPSYILKEPSCIPAYFRKFHKFDRISDMSIFSGWNFVLKEMYFWCSLWAHSFVS